MPAVISSGLSVPSLLVSNAAIAWLWPAAHHHAHAAPHHAIMATHHTHAASHHPAMRHLGLLGDHRHSNGGKAKGGNGCKGEFG